MLFCSGLAFLAFLMAQQILFLCVSEEWFLYLQIFSPEQSFLLSQFIFFIPSDVLFEPTS